MRRFGWLALGWGAVALGMLGVVLPALPTTPFLLVAAVAFGKAAPQLKTWLETHRHFGPPIRDWEERGAISLGAKKLAVTMMVLLFALSLALGLAPWILVLQGVAMSAAAAFILTRPG